MVAQEHRYVARIVWTGDRGVGTRGYRTYDRDHEIRAGVKPAIPGSSDPGFNGDGSRWNPEELLVATLNQCHMLWYLHLCSVNGVVVTAYEDPSEGVMVEGEDGSGRFERVTLRPRVTVTDAEMFERARGLHHEAHRLCFIANSVNFPVDAEPEILVGDGPDGDVGTDGARMAGAEPRRSGRG